LLGTTYQNGLENIPNEHKIYQNGRKIDNIPLKEYHHLQLKDLPQFTQIGIFGFKKIPSGNTGDDHHLADLKRISLL
jgi:hypothetical protein